MKKAGILDMISNNISVVTNIGGYQYRKLRIIFLSLLDLGRSSRPLLLISLTYTYVIEKIMKLAAALTFEL